MFKKAVHIVMAFMILVSSTGFTLSMHFCHDHLIHMAFFGPADNCSGSSETADTCCNNPGGFHMPGHCKNEVVAVESLEDLMAGLTGFQISPDFLLNLQLPVSSCWIIADITPSPFNQVPEFRKPPPEDVNLSDIQVFLL